MQVYHGETYLLRDFSLPDPDDLPGLPEPSAHEVSKGSDTPPA